MAKKKRHAPAEIATKLEEADTLAAQGRTQSEIAQALGVSIMTLHRWRKAKPQGVRPIATRPAGKPTAPSGDLAQSEWQNRIAQLRLENARLRKLVTDLLLEKMQLEEEAQGPDSRAAGKKMKTAVR